MKIVDPLRTFFLVLVCNPHDSVHVMGHTHTNGRGDSAARDLQTIAAEGAFPCSRGHSLCALRNGGECMDEKLSRLERDNDAVSVVIVPRFGSKHFDWFTA